MAIGTGIAALDPNNCRPMQRHGWPSPSPTNSPQHPSNLTPGAAPLGTWYGARCRAHLALPVPVPVVQQFVTSRRQNIARIAPSLCGQRFEVAVRLPPAETVLTSGSSLTLGIDILTAERDDVQGRPRSAQGSQRLCRGKSRGKNFRVARVPFNSTTYVWFRFDLGHQPHTPLQINRL